MKGNKLSFLYNKREEVPLLRGRIYFINLMTIPFFYYKFFSNNPDYLSRLTFYIYLIGILLHSTAVLVFHSSSGNTFNRSALRRVDYAGIFLINITNALPTFVHFVEKDKHVVLLVFHLLINFCGMFACLVMNFIFTNKKLRIMLFWLSHSCGNFVPYKFFIYKMYGPFFLYILGYTLVMIGMFSYYLKKPNFVRGMFEYHELSHLLYTMASICIFTFTFTSMNPTKNHLIYSL